jgi:hypothetical protein
MEKQYSAERFQEETDEVATQLYFNETFSSQKALDFNRPEY